VAVRIRRKVARLHALVFGACILPLAGPFGLSVPSPGNGESEARLRPASQTFVRCHILWLTKFFRSVQGSNACVRRVAIKGHPGLARSKESAAQWNHSAPKKVSATWRRLERPRASVPWATLSVVAPSSTPV
jgi:hypothetical protein